MNIEGVQESIRQRQAAAADSSQPLVKDHGYVTGGQGTTQPTAVSAGYSANADYAEQAMAQNKRDADSGIDSIGSIAKAASKIGMAMGMGG